MFSKHLFYASFLFLGWALPTVFGGWSDNTAGAPWLENTSTRNLGLEGSSWIVKEDKLGRLFVGSSALAVYDGQSWRSYRIANSDAVRDLQFGTNGRIWIGGSNELGYVDEPSIGDFQYHSLVDQLPESERQLGEIWGCGVVGSKVYYLSRTKIYRWDGATFRIWTYPGKSRLFPLRLGEELWFHHLETGLYRLTEEGPALEFDRSRLPDTGIMGLDRDSTGILFVGGLGFYRPGTPARAEFGAELNQFVTDNRLSSFAVRPEGGFAIGTLIGGLLLVQADGTVVRQIDNQAGLPSNAVFSVSSDGHGNIVGSGPTGIFRLESMGRKTFFDQRNGLSGGVTSLDVEGDRSAVVSGQANLLELTPGKNGDARFQPSPIRAAARSVKIIRQGLLVGRHGGVDFLDTGGPHSISDRPAVGVETIQPSRLLADVYWLSETNGMARLDAREFNFAYSPFLPLPDYVKGEIHEDARGRLWISTGGQGLFIHDLKSGETKVVNDPDTGGRFKGVVLMENSSPALFLFADGKVLAANPDGENLRIARQLHGVRPLAIRRITDENAIVVAFKRTTEDDNSSAMQGLGLFQWDETQHVSWRELEMSLADLEKIGSIKTLGFSKETQGQILWIGGSEGLARFDYGTLREQQAPAAPLIRLDTIHSSPPENEGGSAFSFRSHHLNFRILTPDYIRSRDWLFQFRLAQRGGEWSPPTARRAYDFSNLSEGDYRFEVRSVNAAGVTSEPTVFSFRILPPWYRSNGAYVVYALALVLGVWGIIRIREHRIRAEKAKLETLVEIRTAELVKANAAKDDFLAGVSHEIRNPMNGVIGISESLKTTGLDADNQRKFRLLRQCAGHLSSLLEDILDISKVQAGVIELDVKPFDLYELTDAIIAMSASDSEKYHIPVEVAISPGVPRHLHGDPRRIRQILLNFVSNALKFSGRGQVSVTVWCKPTGTPERSEVVFAISDDGPGISPEEQKRLFNRFERGAAARQGRVPGTGLGLALCKGFAEKMGGKIWLESEVGQGSCFYFSAPFLVAADPVEAEPPPSVAVSGTKKALVVDDQEYNRIVLSDLLAKLGYTPTATGSGEEALQLAEKEIFGLVFLDYDLPGMSGLDVARGIRALPTASATAHILATTAFTTPEKQAQCLAAGMNAFLGKPVTMERLRKALVGTGVESSAPSSYPGVTDGLANLRLLANKKNVRFEEELALYISEMQLELDNLGAAIHDEDIPEAAHYAHLLCGRSSFIYERDLEQNFRRLEEIVARGHWADARQLVGELRKLAAALPAKLASGAPTAPPA